MTNCPNCEYHKQRAARWRAEAYKLGGHDVIELPWVGLTDEDKEAIYEEYVSSPHSFIEITEAKLKEKNT